MGARPPIRFYDPEATTLAYRRTLPHLVQVGAVYFVTMHLADCVPLSKQREWDLAIERWLRLNPPPHTSERLEAYAELGYRRRERWLDRGTGSCLLAPEACQEAVTRVLTKCDGDRLWLGDYIVMPNHLHALLQLAEGVELRWVTDAWRDTTSHLVNAELGRNGQIWHKDPFDHIARSEDSLRRMRDYIQRNGRHLPAGKSRAGCGSLFT